MCVCFPISDIVIIIQAIVETVPDSCGPALKAMLDLADVDGNGLIDVTDVITAVECTTVGSCCNA